MSRKKWYLIAGLSLTMFILSSCGDSNDCITCRLGGQVDSICEEELDQYNLVNGTNVTSLDQIESLVQIAGGSCE